MAFCCERSCSLRPRSGRYQRHPRSSAASAGSLAALRYLRYRSGGMLRRTWSAIRSLGAMKSTGDVSVGTTACGSDGIVPFAGTESNGRLELGTGDSREPARATRAHTEYPRHSRNPMWCHAHGPPSQPAVSPAASPTLVQRTSLPNCTRRSAPNATSVLKTAPASPASKPYPITINTSWAALTGSLGVNTAVAMSAATQPAPPR